MALIRNAVLHLQNEQPLLADLLAVPTAADACVVCTNVRTLAGKRPLFVDRIDSLFMFPLQHIRVVEVPTASSAGLMAALGGVPEQAEVQVPDLEIDEDLMRRIRES
jgi:hypothetical protein